MNTSRAINTRMFTTPYLSVLCVCLLLLVSCDSSSNSEKFTVKGVVTSSTGNAVFDAGVTLNTDSDVIESTNTSPDGTYELTGIPEGDYELVITREGYDTIETSISVEGDLERDTQLLGNANINGQITNSQTGSGLDSAEVNFYRGSRVAEADTSLPEFTVITDSNGNYDIDNAATGTYICIIFAEGFNPQILQNLDLSSGTNDFGEVTAVEEVEEGQVRIVLTWGESPDDLDSHLTGPVSDNSTERFHMYFANQNPIDGILLDVDDVTSFGPETTTISILREGLYRYSVFNFSNQNSSGATEIEDSPAKVEVFDSSGLIQRFNPPAADPESGNTWRVFEMEVNSDGSIDLQSLQEYDMVNNSGDGTQFKSRGEKSGISFDPNDF